MFEAVSAIIAAVLKVGVPIYVATLIGASLLLFLPNPIAHQIGVDELRQSYGAYLGGAFVASISLLVATALSVAFSSISNHLDEQRLLRRTLQALRMLTYDEKRFLRPFVTGLSLCTSFSSVWKHWKWLRRFGATRASLPGDRRGDGLRMQVA